MKKICIVGSPGSGKSYFSLKLSGKINIKVYHLDNLFWYPDKTHVTTEEFDKKHLDVINKDEWIIDGNYNRTQDIRFKAADTIIFFDLDTETCLNGIHERKGKKRVDCPFAEDEYTDGFEEYVINFRRDNLPAIYERVQPYLNKTIIFKTRNEASEFLEKL